MRAAASVARDARIPSQLFFRVVLGSLNRNVGSGAVLMRFRPAGNIQRMVA
jgi:hypothetical protein